MEAITIKIKNLLATTTEKDLQNSKFMWVDNYQLTKELIIPITVFLSNDNKYFLFATGTRIYKLKKEYKNTVDMGTIAAAIFYKNRE